MDMKSRVEKVRLLAPIVVLVVILTLSVPGVPAGLAQESSPVIWQVQDPYKLRTSPTRMDTVRTERPMQLDFSIFKGFRLPGKMQLQIRAEAFNAFNTPWFGAPNATWNNAAFGIVAPTQTNDPRNIQLGVRLQF